VHKNREKNTVGMRNRRWKKSEETRKRRGKEKERKPTRCILIGKPLSKVLFGGGGGEGGGGGGGGGGVGGGGSCWGNPLWSTSRSEMGTQGGRYLIVPLVGREVGKNEAVRKKHLINTMPLRKSA